MIKVYNLKNKKEYIEEVATLEYEEWADNKENNKNRRINEKIKNYNLLLNLIHKNKLTMFLFKIIKILN